MGMVGRPSESPENEMAQKGKQAADKAHPQGAHGAPGLTAKRALGGKAVNPGESGPPADSAEEQPL